MFQIIANNASVNKATLVSFEDTDTNTDVSLTKKCAIFFSQAIHMLAVENHQEVLVNQIHVVRECFYNDFSFQRSTTFR